MELTIVMYHYVRDLKHSRYPGIKGLDMDLFRGQTDFLQKHYHFVTVEQIIAAYDGKEELPPKAVLLTFDDAYIDHFTNVFPVLHDRKIQGAFFPPVKAVTEHTVLDVNKIHFILASVSNTNVLLEEIKQLLMHYAHEYVLKPYDYYFDKLAAANRFDSKEVIFIKRLLQVELEETLRNKMTNDLFRKFVSNDEQAFSQELYMSTDQLRCMTQCGMHVGSHGYDHYWLGSLSKEKQEFEIQKSMEVIQKSIWGGVNHYNTVCYPYGNYNEDTLALLKQYDCRLGFTTEVRVASLNDSPLTLPRLDTNDLPKAAK
ncbi:MAG: polysaccharide deacetylase family protein [Prevotellaceae bacterium]|jgi:peptidoglycan/xylan/chitin deacetylase (PgdA/CDA1 family)|nr:polysaccharide deacetylase family protein [Prevotellaceae bacterium]